MNSSGQHYFLCLALFLAAASAGAGDGIVALQTADPACPDDSSDRYVNCGNGTVTDNESGLVWLKDAKCLGDTVDWHTAMEFVAGLSDLPGDDPDDCGLEDGSSPREWRLPSKAEWQAMVADAVAVPCSDPAITNDAGDGCWSVLCAAVGDCSFHRVVSRFYWSSTTVVIAPTWAGDVSLFSGSGNIELKTLRSAYVWPVRSGQ